MPNFNTVVLVGNLTRDPELRYLPDGTAVGAFSLAYTGRKKSVSYFDVVVFGKVAENVAKYVTKGRCVLVSGELTQRTWENPNDGTKRSKIDITAHTVEFLDRPITENNR
jgi:single-strand DNA-binding protein